MNIFWIIIGITAVALPVGVFLWKRKKASVEISLDQATPLSDDDIKRLATELHRARREVFLQCEGDIELAERTWKQLVGQVEEGWPPGVVDEAEARLGLFDRETFPPGTLPHFDGGKS